MVRVAVLDDYQGVALEVADWSVLQQRVDVTVLREWLPDEDAVVEALAEHDVVVAMRERTPFPASLLARLPRLRLLVTTGMRNASIDVAAAQELGITVCGTASQGTSTAELTWALILGWSRHLVEESGNMSAGRWQTTLGTGLAGRTLGVVGLGRIGSQVAAVGRAFGMEVLAWSQHLTDERARTHGARRVDLDELLEASDVVTVHLVLGERTRGLLGADQLARMKPTALLVNTSRGPIVDSDALVEAVRRGDVAGAALDVYDEEPLPAEHPVRSTAGILATPHIGYVSREVYELFYGEAVEDIAAYLDGAPVRVLGA
jgi:phosphoglycerate dehydrogenase-like enzyme